MKIDQCLFGYDDGHKLLSSSLSLGAELSLLTELSDLAPNTVFGRSNGYWTGIPLPGVGRYVLMRTWAAPEMSRPGCVWSHALLIEPRLLESVEHLSMLQRLFIRPSNNADLARYREAISGADISTREPVEPHDDAVVKRLLNSLYGKGSSSIDVAAADDLATPLFAVWSQQWPRLRRNFRFQTAAVRTNAVSSGVRFDITASIGNVLEESTSVTDNYPEWVKAASLDLEDGTEGKLRCFLWQYGNDVKRQKGSFKPLVELWLLSMHELSLKGAKLGSLIKRSFPSTEDALALKLDLINGMLIPDAQPDLVQFWLQQDDIPFLPNPSLDGIERMMKLWPTFSRQLLELAEDASDKNGVIENKIVECVESKILATNFWDLTQPYPNLQNLMLNKQPELLLEGGALKISTEELMRMLPLLKTQDSRLEDFVFSLICKEDDRLISPIFNQFPAIAARQVVRAASESRTASIKAWRDELVRHPELLLTREVLGSVSLQSTLYEYLQQMRLSSPAVLSAGSDPWMAAMSHAVDDLWGEKKDILNCSILVLALASDTVGWKGVERLFQVVHSKILADMLHGEARDILDEWLPKLNWFSNWDLGLRLRLMVVDAYIRNRWPIESFNALTQDRSTRLMLSEAASDVPGGKVLSRTIKH
ncbi:hypothetical protein [Pseudomonas psychrophila]|uniref:Uncharacterized protein n=1 Tax=Pseudomonas psychrophila TaxID=122355 RepID=A0A8I1K7C2_9PSED|nr:hypothetical protein [Pseudomonas psychrophila]MBJ2259679.1 hypothetical protein [Pseudomonas psychrophila]